MAVLFLPDFYLAYKIITMASFEIIWPQIESKVEKMIELRVRPADQIIIDDVDLRNFLKVSRRTLLNYRQMGLKYHKVENKIFYFLSDVLNFIRSHSKETN